MLNIKNLETKSSIDLSVIIVTHNSTAVIGKCLASLFAHFPSEQMNVVIVDSASPEIAYLHQLQIDYPQISILFETENVGFCRGNNIGYRASQKKNSEFVLFLNPDAFTTPDLLAKMIGRMRQADWINVAVSTPLLLGYSLAENRPTGLIDSAGIEMSRYGRFSDRGQGCANVETYGKSAEVDAICGAFMLCRRSALDSVSVNGEVFDERYYMYKEDIDLSLRLRKAGACLMYCSDLVAYHCRGWRGSRVEMPRWTIVQSIRNDWRVWWKFKGYLFPNSVLFFVYLLAKSLVVGVEIWVMRDCLGKGR
jgi:GT2 family glycosyltransferase